MRRSLPQIQVVLQEPAPPVIMGQIMTIQETAAVEAAALAILLIPLLTVMKQILKLA